MALVILVLIAYVAACVMFVPRSREAWTKPDGTMAAYRQRFPSLASQEAGRLLAFIRAAYMALYVLLALVGIALLLALGQFFFGGR